MKILVIFTGGTIGSSLNGEYISTDADKPYKLIHMYEQKYGAAAEFDTISPYTILSENMNCLIYTRLIECIKDNIDKGYDGIIVTHGSDTLQYTAAALSYYLGMNTIPVVVVSSNYVLEDERANGLENFRRAVELIGGGHGKGVLVTYANTGEKCKVHRGTRLMPHMPYSDYLTSLGNQYYGSFNEQGFVKNPLYIEETDELSPRWRLPDKEESGVMLVHPYPGMSYPDISQAARGILLNSYHSGTLCTAALELKAFLEKAADRGIPVFLTGAEPGPDYESCAAYEQLGIKVLPPMSPIAAYIKLCLCPADDIVHIMESRISEDILVLH